MVSDAGPFSVLATLRPSRRRIQQCKFVRPGPAENLCVQLQRLQKSLRFFTVRRQPKPRRWPQQDLRGNASGGVRHRVLRNRRQRQKSRASQHEKMFFFILLLPTNAVSCLAGRRAAGLPTAGRRQHPKRVQTRDSGRRSGATGNWRLHFRHDCSRRARKPRITPASCLCFSMEPANPRRWSGPPPA